MTIFIKPNTTHHNTYYVLAQFDEEVPMLKRVVFAKDESEIIDFLNLCNPKDDDRILFDGTVYAQTGIDLRKATEHNIFLYRNRNASNVNDSLSKITANYIASQARWIKSNMRYSKEMKDDADFNRFLQLMKDYKPANPNCDTAAAEMMADAARFIRKQNFYIS